MSGKSEAVEERRLTFQKRGHFCDLEQVWFSMIRHGSNLSITQASLSHHESTDELLPPAPYPVTLDNISFMYFTAQTSQASRKFPKVSRMLILAP